MGVMFKCDEGLTRWVTAEVQGSSLVLLDVHPDLGTSGGRLHLDVGFNAVGFWRRSWRSAWTRKPRYFLGTTGCQVDIRLTVGELGHEYTDDIDIEVEHTTRRKILQESDLTIEPSVGASSGVKKMKVSFGRVELKRGSTTVLEGRFKTKEATLRALRTNRLLRWHLVSPKTVTVTSDHFLGNLLLFANVRWQGDSIHGTLNVVPDGEHFFDSDHKRISGTWNHIAMLATLKRKVRVHNRTGLEVDFQAVQ